METILEERMADREPEKKPNLEETARLLDGPMGIRSIALTGLFIFACFYTLYFAREFFLPIIIAIVFMFPLNPVVRALKKIRIPEKPVEQVSKAGEQVERLTSISPDGQKPPQRVELKQPGLLDGLFSRTWSFLLGLMVMTILPYFLLASGDMFLRKLIHVLPRFEDKKTAVQIARKIEAHISRYLLTVDMINAGLGTAASLAFWALGMPNPMLWGAMGCLLNFIPYVGALTVIVTVTLVATATFNSLWHALLVPAAYFVLATLEGNFVTPWIIGRRMTLNPVMIFVGLIFWGWLWGIAGVLLTVPMLVMLKIFCDHIEPLAPIGEFVGG
jgi:predicted PurR-regulated permease PerM